MPNPCWWLDNHAKYWGQHTQSYIQSNVNLQEYNIKLSSGKTKILGFVIKKHPNRSKNDNQWTDR